MTITIATSRPFPLPPLKAGEEDLKFVSIMGGADFPPDARAYVGTAGDPVGADLIARMPDSVGLIANFGVGTDNIDFDAAKARGIVVSNTPVVTEDTADLTFALILNACRQVSANERFLRSGQWNAGSPQKTMGITVHGKTLGILGFGAIGQAVARRARGFNMDVLYHNRSRKPEAEAKLGATYVDFDTLLTQSDIISIHTPLTSETRYIIDADVLSKCKQGAVIINAGRGGLIDETALIGALKSGHIGSAGLDVFEGEPSVNPNFIGMDNVVLTPHIGSATTECRTAMMQSVIANVISYLTSGKPVDLVG